MTDNQLPLTIDNTLQKLRAVCFSEERLEIAVLVGSRATGRNRKDSDWDIAIQWHKQIPPLQQFGLTEKLRHNIASQLNIDSATIDLIDMPSARLAMRAAIAEEGIPIKAETLAWHHFLTRTWAELEWLEWDRRHAA